MNTLRAFLISQIKPFNWRKLALVLLLLALSGWLAHQVRIRFPVRSHFMNEYTQKFKTVCVGRYLWDVPQQAIVGPIGQRINEIAIKRMEGEVHSDYQLQLRLDEYERALRKELSKKEDSQVKNILPVGDQGRIFVSYTEDPGLLVADIVGYRQIGNVVFKFTHEASTRHIKEEVIRLEKLMNAIRPRAADEIPTDPGLCIDGAFVAGKGFDDELGIPFQLPGYPGFIMSFSTELGGEPDDSEKLNARMVDAWAQMGYSNFFHIQRKASIQIMEQAGNELMVSFDENGAHSLSANAEIWGDPSKSTQSFKFSMKNTTDDESLHTRYPKLLPDDTAIAVWDAMLKTLRLRPGAI